jgi:hypothetical protein
MLALIQIASYFLNMETKKIELFWEGCQETDFSSYEFVTIWKEVKSVQEGVEIASAFPKCCAFKVHKIGSRIIVSSKADLTRKGKNLENETGTKRLKKIAMRTHLSFKRISTTGGIWSNIMSEDYFKRLIGI